MNTTQQFKKQLPRNVTTAILQFTVTCLVAIWLTPYLLEHLGPAAYGLVPLAALLTQYVAVITAQISMAVRRFLIIEIQKQGGNPNVVFNSAFALYVLLLLVQIPLFAVVIIKINSIFSIPVDLLLDAQILFSCSAASFLLTMLFGVFGVSIYARNRLDISSMIDLLRSIARLILIIVLFLRFGPKLRYIGFIELSLTLLAGLCNLYFWRKLTPELTINFRNIEIKKLAPIFKMSFWTLVNNLGALLYLRTDIWIINKFISPIAAGHYAALLVVSEFVRRLGMLLSNQSGPMIITYSAKEEWEALRKALQIFIKMTAVFIAIPIGIICATAPKLLETWLGKDMVPFHFILCLLVGHLFINVSFFPLFNLQTAVNKVKVPGVITFFLGIANVVCAYVLGVIFDMGILGVALGGGIVLTLKNAIFTPIYGAKLLRLPNMTFIKPIIYSFCVFLFVIAIVQIPFSEWIGFSSGYVYLIVTSIVTSFFACLLIWFCLITKAEKIIITELLPGKIGLYLRRLVDTHGWF